MVNKKRTTTMRSDPLFADFIKGIQAKKLVDEKRFVKSSRITKAIFNQYQKYPNLLKELEGADLK